MDLLFPDSSSEAPLVGIARLAAAGEAIAEGHKVDYFTIENRSLLTRCNSPRVPFRWMINPYRGCEFACKYCYARYTHEFMEMRDGLDFERKIYVKQHSAWLLRQEVRQVRPGQSIAIGTATDPYQPAERKFGITRAIMEEFARHEGFSIGMVTKSNLILRDIDILREIARKNRFSVHITVTTMKTDLARILEPRAPRPDLRMKAVRALAEAGIHVGVNCAPVLPGITDSPAELEALVRAAAQAGAKSIWAHPLFLKPCSEKIFMPFLEQNFPHLVAAYKQRYSARSFLPAEYSRRISALTHKLCAKYKVGEPATRATQFAQAPSTAAQLRLFKE
jgi:DNA repair photolyase